MMYHKTESEMRFQFDQDHLFDMESSEPYVSLVKGNGIKVCDFIYYDENRNQIALIEAKKSCPNVQNLESEEQVAKYATELHFKITHTLLLTIGMAQKRLHRYPHVLPPWFSVALHKSIKWLPILVIKNIEDSWIQPISDRVRKELKGTRKAFQLEELLILSEKKARGNEKDLFYKFSMFSIIKLQC